MSILATNQQAAAINQSIVISPEVPKASEGNFQRIEDKYLLKGEHADHFLGLARAFMFPSYIRENVSFTFIESIYLDSPDLDFFKHHLESRPDRYKMRMRHYGPNGIWEKDDRFLLEIKRKQKGVTKKKRFFIPKSTFQEIKMGKGIRLTRDLISANSELTADKLEKRVLKANMLISEYHLRPRLIVRYKRYAFEDEKGDFRVTFDQNLSGDNLGTFAKNSFMDMPSKPYWPRVGNFIGKMSQAKVVMELKHRQNIPSWMINNIENLDVSKTSFSKYCHFTAKGVYQTLGLTK